jgi:hypothetical protein
MNSLGIIVAHPWLALVAAFALGGIWYWSRSRVALVASIAWVVYAAYEYLMLKRVLCSGDCNIRVDLLLIYPLLLLLFLFSVVHGLWRRAR